MLYSYNPKDKENIPTILWLSVVFIGVVWTAVEAPLSFVLEYTPTTTNLVMDGLLSLIFTVDLILRLKGNLKLPENLKWDSPEIDEPRPYLKSIWFPLDIVTSLPLDIIAHFLAPGLPLGVFGALRLARLARLGRARDLAGLMDHLPKSLRAVIFITGIFLAIHFISCGWMLLNPRTDLDPVSYYNISLYWTITTLTTVGYGDIVPQTNMARIFTMGVMLIGVATYGVIIGNFSRMIMLADRYREERKEKMAGLNQFLKFYNIPASLQRQVFSFYTHLITQNISEQDTRIINELPQALQNELAVYMKIKLIKNVHIFKECSTPCLKMIAQKLEQTYLSPHEYIVKKGEVGEEMFIIGHGEVEVSMGEKVIAQLKAGQFFGEIALLEDTIRSADVMAKAYCDLYTFKKKDFLEVVAKYPDLGEKFKETYNKRKGDRVDLNNAA
ncbi:MAG: hypothetical protein CME64_12540 [Halobacteriovoraceae bacterium]|nr:hypothetical protein [Halobacteriovoraceae bacterium]